MKADYRFLQTSPRNRWPQYVLFCDTVWRNLKNSFLVYRIITPLQHGNHKGTIEDGRF